MSLDRLFHWTCDRCGLGEQKKDYGLPKGWMWSQTMSSPVLHRCAPCLAELPSEEAANWRPGGSRKR